MLQVKNKEKKHLKIVSKVVRVKSKTLLLYCVTRF